MTMLIAGFVVAFVGSTVDLAAGVAFPGTATGPEDLVAAVAPASCLRLVSGLSFEGLCWTRGAARAAAATVVIAETPMVRA